MPFARGTINWVGLTGFMAMRNLHFPFSLFFLNNEELFFLSFFPTIALQVHPDKNKHPKAEIAFKLVSEVFFMISFLFMKVCY